MAAPVGYQLIDKDGNVVQQWGGQWGQMCGVPNPLVLPNGDHILGAAGPGQFQDWTLQFWSMEEPPKEPELTDDQKLKALLTFAETLGLKLT